MAIGATKTFSTSTAFDTEARLVLLPINSDGDKQILVADVNTGSTDVAPIYVKVGEITESDIKITLKNEKFEAKNDVGKVVYSSDTLTGGSCTFSVYSKDAQNIFAKLQNKLVRILFIESVTNDGVYTVKCLPCVRLAYPKPNKIGKLTVMEIEGTLQPLPKTFTIVKADIGSLFSITIPLTATDFIVPAEVFQHFQDY